MNDDLLQIKPYLTTVEYLNYLEKKLGIKRDESGKIIGRTDE